MISGIYKSAVAMDLEEYNHEVITNNIANAATAGFKKDSMVVSPFDQALSSARREIGGGDSETLYQPPLSRDNAKSYTDYGQGGIKTTGNEFDVAISGEGFFAVQTPEGIRYTRSGNFAMNANKQIVMAGKPEYLVLGAGNTPISVPNTGGNIFIGPKGDISSGTDMFGTLQITDFEKPYRLRKTGENLFAPMEEGSGSSADAGSYSIEHKALEMSNVNIVDEMVSMIINQRRYQLGQKMIQSQDQTIQQAINEVGRV